MIKIAIGQIRSSNDLLNNLRQCTSLIRRASESGARALFLPEASDYIATSTAESMRLAQPATSSPFIKGICAEAKRLRLSVSVGVHERGDVAATGDLREQGGHGEATKVKNTLLWIDEEGKISQRYQKINLFDVDVEGGPQIKESDAVEAGTALLPPFDTEVGRIGSLICFDLRFPEFALDLRRKGAQIILYPSAFAPLTGKAHWLPLLQARAIETQCYVIAAAQVGVHSDESKDIVGDGDENGASKIKRQEQGKQKKKRESYGHSVVVDPWGRVIVDMGGEWNGEPEMEVVELDLGLVEKVRREMPLKGR